jgi:general secretion pathway protein J
MQKIKRASLGFTLLEILIALFIFSIVSLILAGALRRVIDADTQTTMHAERLNKLQLALLLLSRDVEQTVSRPVLVASGRPDKEFNGTPTAFAFTHAGLADDAGAATRSGLQRTRYEWHDGALWRVRWTELDQAPTSRAYSRQLLEQVTSARFEYLDKDGHFHTRWPVESRSSEVLPRAVRVNFTIADWGTISQLYVIAAQLGPTIPAAATSASTPQASSP